MSSNRALYIIQPYKAGAKNGKSLAMIIPAHFARDNRIDTSTIFILRNEKSQSGSILLKRVKNINDEEKLMTPADKNFQASSQQVSQESQ